MDCQIVWSPEALDDVDSIADFIARDSQIYASAVVSKIVGQADIAAIASCSGRMVPELNDTNIREKFVYSYRIIYRIDEKRITILAVIHGKRLLEVFRKRFEE